MPAVGGRRVLGEDGQPVLVNSQLLAVLLFQMGAVPTIYVDEGFNVVIGSTLVRNGAGDYTITLPPPAPFAIGSFFIDISVSVGVFAVVTYSLTGPPVTSIRVFGWDAAGAALDLPTVKISLWLI